MAIIDLSKKPNFIKHATHKWVDLVELLCLVNQNREVSKADIRDRFDNMGVSANGFLLDEDSDSPTFATSGDRLEEVVDSIFRHLSYRVYTFDDSYPFVLDRKLLRRKQTLDNKHHLYLLLLSASCLSFITDRSKASKITTDFEILSSRAMSSLMPANSTIKIFGTSLDSNRHYNGELYYKIEQLANDLGEQVSPARTRRAYPPTNNGDGGLDLVAWFPNDDAPARLVIFGGCACTEEWTTKQYSSSHLNWKGRISFTIEPSNVSFIPFCLRNNDGSFYKEASQASSIIVDRERFIRFFQTTYVYDSSFDSFTVLNDIISYEEEII